MFKFNLDQLVWYMMDGAICSAPVITRMIVDNLHDDWACTGEQYEFYQYFGPSGEFYKTVHGVVLSSEAFSSKGELVEWLASGDK